MKETYQYCINNIQYYDYDINQHPTSTTALHSSTNLRRATIARCDHFGNLQPSLVGWNTSRRIGFAGWKLLVSCGYNGVHINDSETWWFGAGQNQEIPVLRFPQAFQTSAKWFLSHFSSMNDSCKFLDSPKCPSSSALGSRIADPCWRHRSRFGRWRLQFSPPGFVFFLPRLKMVNKSTHPATFDPNKGNNA